MYLRQDLRQELGEIQNLCNLSLGHNALFRRHTITRPSRLRAGVRSKAGWWTKTFVLNNFGSVIDMNDIMMFTVLTYKRYLR